MDYLHLAGKGFLQGATEFLPISSSGHLVLYEFFFNETPQNISAPEDIFIDILLHMGTLFAICVVFRSSLYKIFSSLLRPSSWKTKEAWLWKAVLISSFPTAIIGFIIGKKILPLVRSPLWVGIFLLLNGIILWFSHFEAKQESLTWKKAFLIGVIQGFAALPGISRSGSTISLALWCSLDRKMAGEFSFLISIPAILGATLLEFREIETTSIAWGPAFLGLIVSFIAGIFFLKGLLRFLHQGKLHYFSIYCWLLGGGAILSYYL